jgi:hypothetical protein
MTLLSNLQGLVEEHADCAPEDENCDFYREVARLAHNAVPDSDVETERADIARYISMHTYCGPSRRGHDNWCSLHDELAEHLSLSPAPPLEAVDAEPPVPPEFVPAPWGHTDFNPRDLDAICGTCNRRAGQHRGGDGACPQGGYLGYATTVFTTPTPTRTFRSTWSNQ